MNLVIFHLVGTMNGSLTLGIKNGVGIPKQIPARFSFFYVKKMIHGVYKTYDCNMV